MPTKMFHVGWVAFYVLGSSTLNDTNKCLRIYIHIWDKQGWTSLWICVCVLHLNLHVYEGYFCILIQNEILHCKNVEIHLLPSSFLVNLLWEESDLFSNIILNGNAYIYLHSITIIKYLLIVWRWCIKQ